MVPLLLSAALSAVPVDAPLVARPDCGRWAAQPVARRAPQPRIQSLGDLPRANHELAVLRLGPDGCSTPVIVRRDVQFDGRFPAPRR
ncbi:hypothetical protein [Phenylobacterium sp.]|jgi:hypothetical protein|uniref:hypothetical protein n=1 Tax=Phenylobacterium sp. TaxID=1871053 RepID=UPI003784AFDB